MEKETELSAHDEKLYVSSAMIKYGGGFVRHLGEALLRADRQNTKIIKDAFPHYWDQYKEMSGATDKNE